MTQKILKNDISFNHEGKLISGKFNDFYFSPQGGLDESRHVFIDGNNLNERFCSGDCFFIAEAGFGTGLNFLATLDAWQKQSKNAINNTDNWLTYHAIELFPLDIATMRIIHQHWPELEFLSESLLKRYKSGVSQSIEFTRFKTTLILHIGDICKVLPKITDKIDAWYLDGFAPDRNPQMWSEGLFKNIQRLRKNSTTVATYSCARAVRENLFNIGFMAEKTPGFGNKRYMLQAKNIKSY